MVTPEEIATAEQLGSDLMSLVGRKALTPRAVVVTSSLRAQAYTLLLRAYVELRQAVVFVRCKVGNAERIGPTP